MMGEVAYRVWANVVPLAKAHWLTNLASLLDFLKEFCVLPPPVQADYLSCF